MSQFCFIIPFYNESQRFTAEEFFEFSSVINENDFLLVNDGSQDCTGNLLDDLATQHKNIRVLHLGKNYGKAEAIRSGMNYALNSGSYLYYGFFDADLATPLSQIELFKEALFNENRKFLLGSRIKRAGAVIERDSSRHYIGRIIATIINVSILYIPVYDTQCGAKVLSRSIAEEVFKEKFISRWFFDVEILARLQKIYSLAELKEIVYEVPLTIWKEKGNTKIRIIDMILIPIHLYRIFKKYRTL